MRNRRHRHIAQSCDGDRMIDGPVVIFDGECGLCNGMVRFLIRADRYGVFRICGGNSEPGRALLRQANLSPDIAASTVVVVQGNRAWTHSSAVFYIASL